MSKFDERTWREEKVTLLPQTCTPYYFTDTKPNHILISNRSNTDIYLSLSPGVCKTEYAIKIPPKGRKLYARPKTMTQIYLYQDTPEQILIDLSSWEGDFEPSSLNQSLETVPLTGEQVLGIVQVGNFPATQNVNVGNFPATQQISGSVNVGNFPTIQKVDVQNFPTTQQVGGTVQVGNFPATQTVSGNISVTNTPNVNVETQKQSTGYIGGASVTPNDTTDLTKVSKSLYIGGTGDLSIILSDGSDILLKALPIGLYPFAVKRIKQTGTTATNIVALY